MKKYYILIILFLFVNVCFVTSQENVIYLKNPSFEQEDMSFLFNNNKASWVDCGFQTEESPAMHAGLQEVALAPQHLKGYLSMVVRDNNTWDAVGQRLTKPLEAGKCYQFSLQLAKAENYYTRNGGSKVNYRNPIRLLVWGGNSFCEAGQLLAKTDLIKNDTWEPYEFIFQPTTTVTYLSLHAYYLNPLSVSYNGNVLIDNASAIYEVACENVTIPKQDENLMVLQPRNIEELERFITTHSPNITFQKNAELQQWSQVYFSVIGKSISHFKNYQLLIAVKGKSEKQIQKRIQFLNDFLQQQGVQPTACQCVEYLENKSDENWLSETKNLAFKIDVKPLHTILKRTE